jgi:hypothetical protein
MFIRQKETLKVSVVDIDSLNQKARCCLSHTDMEVDRQTLVIKPFIDPGEIAKLCFQVVG